MLAGLQYRVGSAGASHVKVCFDTYREFHMLFFLDKKSNRSTTSVAILANDYARVLYFSTGQKKHYDLRSSICR
jgi:hypothetical protein